MSTIERPEIRTTGLLTQSWAIARRNFRHIRRMPEMLLDVTIQPVMFVLLFAYVFGSSIDVATPAGYRAFLLAGIMAQTMAFASFIVAVGLTADLDKGIVDRMRSLPINPAAVLVGRSISSLAHASIGLVVMSLTGLVIGWRIHTNVFEAALGYLLLLGWGFAMIWVGHLGRLRHALGRGGQRGHVRDDVPDHVPGQHLRARPTGCRRCCASSPSGTRSPR